MPGFDELADESKTIFFELNNIKKTLSSIGMQNFTKLKEIASQNIKNLKNIQILDIYFDASQQTLVNLTLRLEFQSEIETLRTEVIEFEVTKIIENLKSNFEIEI